MCTVWYMQDLAGTVLIRRELVCGGESVNRVPIGEVLCGAAAQGRVFCAGNAKKGRLCGKCKEGPTVQEMHGNAFCEERLREGKRLMSGKRRGVSDMKRKSMNRVVCSIIALAVLVFCLWPASMDAAASSMSSVTSASIKEKEEQISQKKNEKDSLQDSLAGLKTLKKDLEIQKAGLKEYLKELDDTLALVVQNIADLKEKIRVKEEEIRETEAELESAIRREENQREAMAIHIRLVYERGSDSMVDMLLRAKSFGDFLNRADHVEKMVAYDQEMLEAYKMVTEYVELCKEELQLEKEILDETKAGVEAEQKNLEDLIEQKNRDITRYENDIDNKEKAIKEYEEQIRLQEEEIKLLEQAVAEERKKLLASNGKVISYDGGMFKFPLASMTAVSDEYGWRINPISGKQEFHNGVDLAAPGGTDIYAAYDGIVVGAAYNNSMGNYVMINHGDGLYTIYMHASKLYVKKDDVVARGETIAAVGTTGYSTGNHLHFTVRLNGSYVSPWEYLKQ